MNPERLQLIAQVATWYYEDDLSQEEIADRVGKSRSMVSRMLQEAREQGMVEIRVRYPLKTDSSLAQRLRDSFDLTDALVLADPPADHEALLKRLGELAADRLRRSLTPDIVLGISWGTAVYHVVESLPSLSMGDAEVVQIIGAVGHGDPLVDGTELARWLAQKLGAGFRSLSAPLVVESDSVARGLLHDRAIADVLSHAAEADVAVIGVGVLAPPAMSSLWRAGYLTQRDLEQLTSSGAVGDVLARPLDIHGQPVDVSFNRRVIGIDLDTLRGIKQVIAVAGGVVKAPAILAALRGHYADILVTDSETAARILSLHRHDEGATL